MTLGLAMTVPVMTFRDRDEQAFPNSIREDRFESHKEDLQQRVNRGLLTQEEADYMSENFGNCYGSGRHEGYHMGYGRNRDETRGSSKHMGNGRSRQGQRNCHKNY